MQFVATHGERDVREPDLRKACCASASSNRWRVCWPARSAWITGLRREQSDNRGDVSAVQRADDEGPRQVQPAGRLELGRRVALHRHARGALQPAARRVHAQHRLRPCTRAIAVGEDFRAGRWWWEDEKPRNAACTSGRPEVSMKKPRDERASSVEQLLPQLDHTHLDWLEEEAIFILRETVAAFERPALLFSGGKDSCVVLRLAERPSRRQPDGQLKGKPALPAAARRHRPQLPEVIEFRDRASPRWASASSSATWKTPSSAARCAWRTAGIAQRPPDGDAARSHRGHRFDALIGGARRDEEKARAKERIFSHRDSFGQWQPGTAPRAVDAVQHAHPPGEHIRAFPISNWTELDVWLYIARANIPLPNLIYYAHAPGDPPQGPAGAADRRDAAARPAKRSRPRRCASAPWAT